MTKNILSQVYLMRETKKFDLRCEVKNGEWINVEKNEKKMKDIFINMYETILLYFVIIWRETWK